MANWTEDVASNPRYKKLSSGKKDKVRLNFFNKEIAPNLKPEEIDHARKYFFEKTSKSDYGAGPKDISEPLLGHKTQQALGGARVGATLGAAESTAPPPKGFGEKASYYGGQLAGSVPAWMLGEGIIGPAVSKAIPAMAKTALEAAPGAYRAIPEGIKALLPRMAHGGALAGLMFPAQEVASSHGAALSHPGALAESAGKGMFTGAAFEGTFGYIASKFPKLFTKPVEAPPSEYPVSQGLPTKPAFKSEPPGVLSAQKDVLSARAEANAHVSGTPFEFTPREQPTVSLDALAEKLQNAKDFNVPLKAILTKQEQDLASKIGDRIEFAKKMNIPQEVVTSAEERAMTKPPAPEPPGRPTQIPPNAIAKVGTAERTLAERQFELRKKLSVPKAEPAGTSVPPPVPKNTPSPEVRAVVETDALAPAATSTEGMRTKVGAASKKIDSVTAKMEELSNRAKTVMEESAAIGETGTIDKGKRPGFRKGGTVLNEAELKAYNVSHNLIKEAEAKLITATEEVAGLKSAIESSGDALSANTVRILDANFQAAKKKLNRMAEEWSVQRFAVNRSMKAFDSPLPRHIIDTLKEQQVLVAGLKDVREKVPITENLINGFKNWKSLSPKERDIFWKDMVNQFRLNYFSTFSWTLDFFGNASELVAQTAGGLGHDIGYIGAKGKFNFPATQGMLSSLKRRIQAPTAQLDKRIEEGLGSTFMGEHISGGFKGKKGAFYTRTGPVSKAYDYLVGAPLYAKGAIDITAKRIGSYSRLYRDAVIAADETMQVGSSRQDFIQKFLNNPPDEAIASAIEYGNKAGFNRPLTKMEEKIANNTTVQLVVDVFARWPFQFTRWGGEMLGLNPSMLKKIATQKAGIEDVGEYLAKTATGYGGLYLIDKLYDSVDFNSMEYVKENGNRVRLSNRDPLTSALWLLAVVKGDAPRAAAGLKFASVPGARLASGEGGMLTSIIKQFQRVQRNRNINPKKLSHEMTDIINRMIPGQALLGALKSVLDPTLREGLGANLPGISLARPARVDPTTGGNRRIKNVLPGTDIQLPGPLGTPIPGAERVFNPVEQILSKYSLRVYRGMGGSIAGTQPADMPDNMIRDWQREMGKARQQIFNPAIKSGLMNALDKLSYEQSRKIVMGMDRQAAQLARAKMSMKFGVAQKPLRKLGRFESARPKKYGRVPIPSKFKDLLIDQ